MLPTQRRELESNVTDPSQPNELDPTIVDGQDDAASAADVDATIGPDDDATVFPDEEPIEPAATVVTNDVAGNEPEDDDDATVFPDDEPPAQTIAEDAPDEDDDATVFPDEEPAPAAATVVTGSEPEEDDDATVFPNEDPAPASVGSQPLATTYVTPDDQDQTVAPDEPDDDATVYSDAGETPGGDDDQTIMGDEEAASVATRSGQTALPQTVAGTVDGLESVSETSTGESQSGRTRMSFGKFKGSKTKMESSGKGAAAKKKQEPEGPRYDLVDNFAHGGMGNIWKAHDQKIHRDVAYKELLPRALRRPRVVDRFVQEAQITGQLEHPGIVPIYDLGTQENGAPFYAMKLVHGVEMKDRIEEMHELPKDSSEYHRMFVKLLRNFIDTCYALAFAHERGVLHRDLKPQNVMLGAFGETLVLDWGLAKILTGPGDVSDGGVMISGDYDEKFDADEAMAGESLGSLAQATTATKIVDESVSPSVAATFLTGTVQTDSRTEGTETKYGSVMGTPAYMPPEQAEGKLDLMDGRTDIYSLGAILYEIMTNDAPIPRSKMDEMLDYVINKPITPPIEREPTSPRPLSAIAMKALAKRREDRYRTALDLAHDVEDYLADEPVSAYDEPWYDKARRWIKRHRTLVTTSAAVVILVVVVSVLWSTIESSRIGRLQSAAELKLNEARSLSADGEFDDAKLLLNEATGLIGNEDSLQALKTGIEGQLAAVDRLIEATERDRVSRLELQAEQDLSSAQDIIEAGTNLGDARAALTEIITRLTEEPELVEVRTRAELELQAVTTLIENQTRQVEAEERFAKFLDLVDQARFFATVTTGDDLIQNAETAREAAESAFQLYGGLSDEYLATTPPLLSEQQVEEVRQGSYELLLIQAETELTLARNADDTAQQESAGRALDALKLAESIGIESQALVLRRARYYDVTGDENQRDLTLLAAEEIKPSSALDHFLIGEEQRRAAQFEKALQSYRQALQSDPDHFWSLHQMAQTHLLSGQADAAVAGYTACIARRPDERICYLTRGIAYASLGQIEPALADLNRAHELDPTLYAVYLNRGAVHVAAKDLDSAITDFERAAELRDTYAGPYVNLGEVYRIQKSYDESEKALTRAIELDATNAKAHRIRALTRLQLMNDDGARADFGKVIELDDDPLSDADAWQQIGKTWHRGGEPEQALDAYDNSIAANPQNSDNYRLKAEVLLALNRDDEAVESFTKFLEFGKPVGDVYRARSLALSKLGRFREAMNDYTRALELEPSANMLVRRGWAYLLEANKLALADFDAAVSENPESADAWNGRGYARVMLGDYANAVSDADEAVKRANRQVEVEGPSAWPHVYNAATIYAQAVSKVLVDGRRTPEDREKLASQLTIKSIQIIGLAIQAAGPTQRAAVIQTLQTDTAINPIRNRPEFRQAFAPKPPPQNN